MPPDRRLEPTPEQVATLTEFLDQLVAGLDLPARQVLTMRLDGHTVVEIAQELEVSERTVFRRIDQIRDRALRLGMSEEERHGQ